MIRATMEYLFLVDPFVRIFSTSHRSLGCFKLL